MINFFDINLYFVCILGLLLGSFLNVIIYRLPRGLSFSKGRSHCPHCDEIIRWYDLIPLFSYLFLRGKCRHCKGHISIQYPLVELFTSTLFTLVYSYITFTGKFTAPHILIFIILLFAVVGIFTDFLYHGTFNFSTIYLFVIYIVFRLIQSHNFKATGISVLQSLSYFIPIVFVAGYYYFKVKGKLSISILLFAILTVLSYVSLTKFEFYLNPHIIYPLINWLPLILILIIADYIVKKLIKNIKIANILHSFFTWFGFVTYFMFTFGENNSLLNFSIYKGIFSISGKNIIILILFSFFYLFFIEIFESFDNNEEEIDNNEELIKRDENIFTNCIGDGDILTLPFVGMFLGYQHIFSFYTLLGINILAIYCLIFKKGFNYIIPLYPFIILNIFIISTISFF